MKKALIFFGIAALISATGCSNVNSSNTQAEANAEETVVAATQGAIVYFNLDRIVSEYDMANDLRSVVETKANSISEEINRRGTKLEKDIKDFQDKINKGLLTQSVAQQQSNKLAQQEQEFNNYANQKQQEIAEEQMVMSNQIADAINAYILEYNAEKKYAMILSTQGDILTTPVVAGAAELDITDELLNGLNEAYVKTK